MDAEDIKIASEILGLAVSAMGKVQYILSREGTGFTPSEKTHIKQGLADARDALDRAITAAGG
jgi:hypothetical protein